MVQNKRKQNKNSSISTILLIIVLCVGAGIMAYPTVSDWWNSKVQSRAIVSYEDKISSMQEEDFSQYFEEADAFNKRLAAVGSASALMKPEQFTHYEDVLNVTGTGIIGYVTIDKINVELAIYHGTGDAALNTGVGHLEGTSFPIGGESTHSVLSAHRGLPSARLFTDLDQLEIGDTFYVTVLNEIFTYEVDQITIVLPNEMDNIYIEDGKDYVTLMTCTPYGVNSHRLLVRGHRVDNAEKAHIRVVAEAYKVDALLVAAVVAVPILLILLTAVLLGTRKRK